MHTLLSQNDLLKTAAGKARFLEEVVAAHYLALVKKDVQKAVNLFIAYFDTQSEAVFERLTGQLAPEPEWLFRFLKLTLFEGRLNYSKSQLANGGGAENLGGSSSSNNNNGSSSSSSSESHRKLFKLCTNGTLQERYLELAAQLEPATILAVLDVLSEVADSAALRICRAAGVKEGEAYVYERLKQYPAAFSLLLEDFKGTVNESIQYTFNHLNSGSGGGSGKKSSQKAIESGSNLALPSFAAIDGKFTRLLDFCKRAFGRHSSGAKNEAFCLATLEFLIHTKTALNGIFKMRDDEVDGDGGDGEGEGGGGKILPEYLHLLAEPSRRPQIEALIGHYNHRFRLLFEKLVSVMLRHFSLLDLFDFIVKKVLVNESSGTSHGGGGGENLYDVREMLLVILENYHYEKSLLELVNSMLGGEHHQLTSRFQAANVRSRNVRQAHCGLCLRPTTATTATSLTSPSNIVLFSCTHLFHEHCFEERMKGGRRRKREGQLQQQQRLCPLCNSHLMREKGGGGGKEEEHEEGEEEDEEGEEEGDQSRRAALNGKQQQQQQQSQQQTLLLNETQFRALNYFHHGRLGPGRAGGRRSRRQ